MFRIDIKVENARPAELKNVRAVSRLFAVMYWRIEQIRDWTEFATKAKQRHSRREQERQAAERRRAEQARVEGEQRRIERARVDAERAAEAEGHCIEEEETKRKKRLFGWLVLFESGVYVVVFFLRCRS